MTRPNARRPGTSGRDRRPDRRDKEANSAGERLQKVLAAAGVGSRRDCEEIIVEGRVEIDRKVVTELGTRVDPVKQEIRVDGEKLKQPKRLYFAVNKPPGVVSTSFDPSGRARVIDLVPTDERVFAVGRLDRFSEGLILITNDGEFANRLTHPRYGVEKTYLVRVAGSPTTVELDKLRRGVHLSDGFFRVDSIRIKGRHKQSTDLVIVLNEGRNREIRRILAKVGHKVVELKRVAVGNLKLGEMPTGAWRKLQPSEINSLLEMAQVKRRESKNKRPARPAGDGTTAPASGFKPTKGKRPDNKFQAAQEQMASREELLIEDLGETYEDDEIVDFRADDDAGSSIPRGDVIEYADEEFDLEYGSGANFSSGGDEARAERPARARPPAKTNDRPPARPQRREATSEERPRKAVGAKPARKPIGAKPAGDKTTGGKPFGKPATGRRDRGAKAAGGNKPLGKKAAGKAAAEKRFGGKGGKPAKKGRR